ELLDPVVAPIGYVDGACLVHGNTPGQVQLPGTVSAFAPGTEKCPIFGIALNAVVAAVDHQEMLVAIKGQASRAVKLAIAPALLAPLGQKCALLIEDGNALQGLVGDIDVLILVQRHS